MCIYLLRHKVTGKEYVGKTVASVRSRMRGHKARAKSGATYPLSVAIREDGIEAFEVTILATASAHEDLWRLEQQHIASRGTLYPHGYNLTSGGRGNYGWKVPAEAREKMAAAKRGKSTWNKGLQMSPEQRNALSLARRGRPRTPAQIAAVAAMQSPAAIAKMAASRRGVKMSPARLAAHSEAMKRGQAGRHARAVAEFAYRLQRKG